MQREMLKGYKGCDDGMVVELEINLKDPNNLERTGEMDPGPAMFWFWKKPKIFRAIDRDHAMYRCQRARVVGIENVLTGETAEMARCGRYDSLYDVLCYKMHRD